MDELRTNIRFSWRQMLKTPGLTFAILLCLALGIGANSAMFSFARSLLSPSEHLEEPERLVRLFIERSSGLEFGSFSYPDYRDLREQSEVFSDLAVETPTPMNLNLEGRSERFWGSLVSGNYFETLGVEVTAGRSFRPDEDVSPGADPLAVISHAFWQRRFGGSSDVIGRTLSINGHPFTIIGVAPEGFDGANIGFASDLWVPTMMYRTIMPGRDLEDRGQYWLGYVIGRLAPGVGLEQAENRVDTFMRQLGERYPDTNVGKTVALYPEKSASLHPMMRGAFVGFLALMFTVVGLVLLLACVNVAGLLMAKAAARRREMAVRLALGIGRGRLIRQLLTESTLLAVTAGILGLVLSIVLIRLIQSFQVPIDFPISLDPELDPAVLGFTFLIAVITGVLFGLAPALEAVRTDLVTPLKSGGAASNTGTFLLRKVMTVSQVVLSMILLIGAGLALQSFRNANEIDLGLDPSNLAIASVDLDIQGYDETRGTQLVHSLKERFETLPGVRSVGYANVVPLSLSRQQAFVLPQDYELPEGSNRPIIGYNLIGPDYFEAMGVRLLQGRDFTLRDGTEGPAVAIVNSSFADKYWPGQRAIGKTLVSFDETFEVVGLVEDGKYFTLGEEATPFLYLPLERHYRGNLTFFVRTTSNPTSVLNPIRTQVASFDPDLAVHNLKTMHEQLRFALLPARLAAMVISAFAGLALLLSAVGLFALVSNWVGQRMRDIAIRKAIGAPAGTIVKLVIWQGMSLALVGLAVGVTVGYLLSRLASGLLYGIEASSPMPYVAATLALLVVVVLATALPTRRALRIGMVSALRIE